LTERLQRIVFITIAISIVLVLSYLSISRPGYFVSQTYLGGLLILEFMAAAVWLYRKAFFVLVVVSFLLAGVDLPVGSAWTMVRWMVLGLGALVGCAIMLKERRYKFGFYHVVAIFAVLAAAVSAAVSRFAFVSALKVSSLALLFIYAATGARLAVVGRENRFFRGLIIGCDVLVAILAFFYLLGIEAMGNPNSLGAVMATVAAPILLWSTLLDQTPFARRCQWFAFAVAMYLTFASHARAAMLAAFVSCAVLCLGLRRYGLMARGIGILAILVAASAIFQPDVFSRTMSAISADVVFKGKDPRLGILISRQSPWQDTMDAIRQHLWFGTGFGTSDTGQDATESFGRFSSNTGITTEHGSSYLAITSWVGMLGVLPFFLLIGTTVVKIARTVGWMFRTGNPSHGAIPLAMVTLAGMTHAVFEDWLFAPGYYLCVFYWCMAFVLVDQVAALAALDSRIQVPQFAGRTELNAAASVQ
jgi:O-antigen ligase